MKILVTGATGLIGRNLLKRLKGDITVVARDEDKLIDLQKKFPRIKAIVGDISSTYIAKEATRGVDIIYHLAALRAIGKGEIDTIECVETNIVGTMNLLLHFNGKKFITLSTDKAVQIKSIYGATKFIVEGLVREYSRHCPNIEYRVIRCGNVFGSTDSVMSVWKDCLQNGKPIKVTDLYATRYFCTVDRVIDCMLAKKKTNLKMKSVSLIDLLEAMQMRYGRAKVIKEIGIQKGENKHEKMSDDGLSSFEAKRYTIKELLKLI